MKISLLIKTIFSFIYVNKRLRSVIKDSELIHAHTTFADGFLAYLLSFFFKKEYIVNVRNTDVNIYLKYFPHLRFLCHLIFKKAKKVVFISPGHVSLIETKYPKILQGIKYSIQPNGINDFWHENSIDFKANKAGNKILFVGKFDNNKNIHSVVKAFKYCRNNLNLDCQLVLVGGDAVELSNIGVFLDDDKHISVFDRLPKKKLLNLYRDSRVFVMPSFRETFGLVYIEALTQGVPVICSLNQGIYGYINDARIAKFVNPNSATDIASAIVSFFDTDFSDINFREVTESFNWQLIARNYLYKIYGKDDL
ncbi:MAG: glycosyltransferase family 4 protein [Colwellia sp.]|nr:glycosyltransferase family 4 protein [Colwellia sp.]